MAFRNALSSCIRAAILAGCTAAAATGFGAVEVEPLYQNQDEWGGIWTYLVPWEFDELAVPADYYYRRPSAAYGGNENVGAQSQAGGPTLNDQDSAGADQQNRELQGREADWSRREPGRYDELLRPNRRDVGLRYRRQRYDVQPPGTGTRAAEIGETQSSREQIGPFDQQPRANRRSLGLSERRQRHVPRGR